MKRSRTGSKSSESVLAGSKDEPPKKVAKRRVKSVTQSPVVPESHCPAVLAPPVKHAPRPISASKLGSLPMHGEHLPDEGYVSIPKLAERVCGNLGSIMGKIRDFKLKGGSCVSQ